ncbi:MAG: GIY-YIG nuclease family protein [Patescibacteria group bacterium]
MRGIIRIGLGGSNVISSEPEGRVEKSKGGDMGRHYYVYILMNEWHTVSYVGITSSLLKRLWQHQEKVVESFTKKYRINTLVYYETYNTPFEAIAREKQLKRWSRAKKVAIIKTINPTFRDLSKDWQ